MRTFSKSVISKTFFGIVTIFNLGLAANTLEDINIDFFAQDEELLHVECGKVSCAAGDGTRYACGTSVESCSPTERNCGCETAI